MRQKIFCLRCFKKTKKRESHQLCLHWFVLLIKCCCLILSFHICTYFLHSMSLKIKKIVCVKLNILLNCCGMRGNSKNRRNNQIYFSDMAKDNCIKLKRIKKREKFIKFWFMMEIGKTIYLMYFT